MNREVEIWLIPAFFYYYFLCSAESSLLFLLHVIHGPFWKVCESAIVLHREHSTWKHSRRLKSLHLSTDVAFRYQPATCDGWSWNLSATQVFRQSGFIANRFRERLIPGLCWRIALVQSLGTEIEAHPWQSNGDKTHHQRIIYGETGDGNHKFPFHSIVRTDNLNEHQMEALITVKKDGLAF